MSWDGAALLAAAIRAACLAKAPRRTVQAVAAAVTGVLVRPTAAAEPRAAASVPAGAQSAHDEAASPDQLVDSLRVARRAQRARKKERRRAAKLAATDARAPPPNTAGLQPGAEALQPCDSAAGSRADPGGSPAAEPAQALVTPSDAVPLQHSGGDINLQHAPGVAERADDSESCHTLSARHAADPQSDAGSRRSGTLAGGSLQSGLGGAAALPRRRPQPYLKQEGR